MLSKEEINQVKESLTVQAITSKVGCEDYPNCICMKKDLIIVLQYIDQLEQKEKRLKDRLEKDVINITKTLQDGKHCDDYSRCRLKAYRTKTKEILKFIGGENE